jgi:hypothetical protein
MIDYDLRSGGRPLAASGTMQERGSGGVLATPTSFEYAMPRYHLVPALTALRRPFDAEPRDWAISDPEPRSPDEVTQRWWPREHAALPYKIVEIKAHQFGMFRRMDSIIYALAAELPSAAKVSRTGAAVSAALVISDSPGSITVLARSPVHDTVVAWGLGPSKDLIVGLETGLGPDSSVPAARIRFGAHAPPLLSELVPGSTAISDPVFTRASSSADTLPTQAEIATSQMLGSVTFQRRQKVGIYWETYGIAGGDSVDLAVWIERQSVQGPARRLGILLGIAKDLNTPIAISWSERSPMPTVPLGAKGVPIVGRSINLDLADLPAGDYLLQVAVAKPGRAPVRGQRKFVIQ